MTFLSPLGGLAALLALIPVAALALATRRAEEGATLLGLRPAPRRTQLGALALAAGACLCAGAAAAQPVIERTQHQQVRSRSEILYVVDVSRSMAAARSVSSPTRLASARDVVRALHAATPDVPSGLAGLTDRVLPYLFPTADPASFDSTLRRSVTLESPRPQQVARNATSFAALSALAGTGFFDRSARTRTCVVVTDGEGRSSPGTLPCRLVVVRVGSGADRVRGPDGTLEAAYTPDPAAETKVQALAAATGGRAFTAAGPAAARLRALAEAGPVVRAPSRTARHGLAPWLALASLALALGLLALRAGESLRLATVRVYTRGVANRGVSR